LNPWSWEYSASIALEEEEEKVSNWLIWLMVGIGVVLAVGIFFLAPLFITISITKPFDIQRSSPLFNLVEGLIRVVFFIAYLWLVGLMPDIKRVFAYHGAEHMAVNAYEDGVPLEVESIAKYSTAHPRCGTSFLFIVMVIAILVFTLVNTPTIWLLVLSRIVLIPVIAAIAYEVTSFAGRHTGNRLVRIILAPGLWLQSLTTRKPDDRMLEVSITALKKVQELEEPAGRGYTSDNGDGS
jgi:uncharacterized protein YqhQ